MGKTFQKYENWKNVKRNLRRNHRYRRHSCSTSHIRREQRLTVYRRSQVQERMSGSCGAEHVKIANDMSLGNLRQT